MTTRLTVVRGLRRLALLGLLGLAGLGMAPVHAAVTCFSDIDGPNDPPGDGQGDITRFCLDNANLPTSFDVYMNWDESRFSGANTGDGCVLFDTNGDAGGNVDFAICISVGGNPGRMVAGPLLYSCGNTDPDKCTSPVQIIPSGSTACSAAVQSSDPFPSGDNYPNDTVGVCTIDVSDIPAGGNRINFCSFPSLNPNSAPKDCAGAIGGGFINIVKVADPDDGTPFNFSLDGQTYTINGSGGMTVSLASGQTYTIAEAIPADWMLSSVSCIDNRTSQPVGTFDNVDSVSGLQLDASDDFTCTFTNTKSFVDLVLAKSVSNSTPAVGDTLTYTLQLTNNGPVAATSINVNDILPAGLTYAGGSISGGDSRNDSDPSGSGLAWVVNSLGAGNSTALTFQATVDAGTAGSSITNSATKTQTQLDTDTTLDTPTVTINVSTFLGTDGLITITDPSVPGDVLTISVTDADLDTTAGVDTVVVEVDGSNGENETLTLTETGATTGIFTGTLNTVYGTAAGTNDDGTLTTQAGDTVTASYTDSPDATGGSTLRTATGTVNGGTDGLITITDPSVPGDVLTISVTDADLDTTAGVDTVVVEVDGSNGENETLTLTETGASTGVFTGTLNTVYGSAAGTNDDGTLTTQAGDTVTASYTDSPDASGGSTLRTATGTVNPGVSLPASLSGIVWLDLNHDDLNQPGEPLQPNWRVDLFQNSTQVDSALTDNNGYYAFTSVPAGSDYSLRYTHPVTGVVWSVISNITLPSGATIIDQNLALDPSGIVYDSGSRNPVQGAVLTLLGSSGNPLPGACLLDPSQQAQLTDVTGYYRFDIIAGADPACPSVETNYAIAVTGPAGYLPAPSSSILPQATALDPTGGPDPYLVSPSNTAPAGAAPTTYYLTLALESGDPDVVNNHIPLDPLAAAGEIVLTKVAAKRQVSIGDMVYYTLTAENVAPGMLTDITLSDLIPGGFKYVDDSAELVTAGADGVLGTADDVRTPITPVGTRPMQFTNLDFAIGESLQVRYLLRVGAGVEAGEYVNRATPLYNGAAAGNSATATVQVVADPIFDKTTVIGKVFHDRDGDGWQDPADATQLQLQVRLDSALFIKGSTRVESGGITRDVATADAATLVTGLELGALSGRSSVTDLPEQHRLIVRVGLYSPQAPALILSTGEGTRVHVDADGTVRHEHTGDKAAGMSGQDISVQRRIVAAERGYELLVTIINYGVEEAGIPGVRLATVSGLLVETDSDGRYHLADIDPGQRARGRNFILKADKVTLPRGSRFTTENPRVLRITGGLMNKINFGVQLPAQAQPEKAAHISLGEVFFDFDSADIKAGNAALLEKIATAIREYRCGVITITGHTDAAGSRDYNQRLGERRAESVRRALEKLLDREVLEQVEIRVEPATAGQVSLVQPPVFTGSLLGSLLDLLVPPVHAGEDAGCTAMLCDADAGVVIDVVSRGELEPRSPNDTAAGRADNRRVDMLFTGRMQLRDGGSIWATEDPAVIEPRLNVSGPVYLSVRDGHVNGPAVFRLYSNYSAFIERWVLGIYAASDTDLVNPLQEIHGTHLGYDTLVEWDGSVAAGAPLRAGDELVYVLRVFDGSGRFDETAPVHVLLGVEPAMDKRKATTESLAAYGENNLFHQTIPLAGSRVRIHGADVPPGYAIAIDGEPVPLDQGGKFAVERILPPGEYSMDVEVTDARNDTWHRPLGVQVSGGYLFMVGIADLTLGENDFSGDNSALPADDNDPNGSFSEGRLAFYLKSKFQGKYRLTAQLDTTEEDLDEVFSQLHKQDPRSVFRRLDPDRYYPSFGDESTTTSDVDSQGRFYARLDWDKSQALWGNYNTGITGNEYLQYDRSLYGGKLDLRDIDTTRFGDARRAIKVFGSDPNTALAHNEFEGTGGSLYYLRDTDIVQGSEKVWVEVRERNTNRVLENVTLHPGSDYQLDDIQGRIILNRPLAQVTAGVAPNVIKDEPLDGNEVYLMVDYEYLPDDFDSDKLTYGVSGKDWLSDRLGLGGTYVHEDRDGTNYELKGADITLRHGLGTYFKAEYARSDARQTTDGFSSNDGGLSFSELNSSSAEDVSGNAVKLEARVNHAEVTQGRAAGLSTVWWKRRDAGFSIARIDDGIETKEYGAESSWEATGQLSLSVRGAVVDKKDDSNDRSLALQADYRTLGPWTLSSELRYVSEDPEGLESSEATLAGAGVDYEFAPGSSVYGRLQGTLARDSGYDANNMVTLGAKTQLSKQLGVNVEGSAGNRGDAIQLGADYRVGADYSFYSSYVYSTDRVDGRKGVAVVGQRRQMGNSLQVFTENQFSSGDEQNGIATVYGLDYTPGKEWSFSALLQTSDPDDTEDGLDRKAVSLGANYRGERFLFGNKLEYRRDRTDEDTTQWLTVNNFRYLYSDALTWVGKLNLSWTDNEDTGLDDGRFAEVDLGLAYRPVSNDRLNMLGKYTYLYDLDSSGQSNAATDTDERSHVVSIEGIYDLTRRWELGAKLAWKRGEVREQRDAGHWYRTVKQLAVVRGRYHMTRQWDGLLEYRWLDVEEADDSRQGALVGIDRHINDHVRVGVGYNFTDFSDDLTDLDYQNSGWFINITGKI